jgi:ABC-2 type transport system permease protein
MKYLYLLYKDILLMLKDRAGLFLMFLMPLMLVLVMTVLQNNTFKAVSETKLDLLILNKDQDTFGNTVAKALLKQDIFNISQKIDEKPLTLERLKEAVAQGRYKIGLYIPAGITKTVKQALNQSVMSFFQGTQQSQKRPESKAELLIYIDPATRESYRVSMLSSIREMAAKIKKEFILSEIFKVMNERFEMPFKKFQINEDIVTIKAEYAVDAKIAIMPNSVQHNVPAWTLFAMFFIINSLAGNMINERNEGSYLRLLTAPVSFFLIISSKIIVYYLICLVQFILMLMMGLYILPLIDMPSLELGSNIGALFLIASASALAAVGYSVLIGVVATTYHQVATFGAISVVIMSAIGGIWVPVFAMPKFMQMVSNISPLNWGIEGFYDIFIRNGDVAAILPNTTLLLLFALICIISAIIFNNYKMIQ